MLRLLLLLLVAVLAYVRFAKRDYAADLVPSPVAQHPLLPVPLVEKDERGGEEEEDKEEEEEEDLRSSFRDARAQRRPLLPSKTNLTRLAQEIQRRQNATSSNRTGKARSLSWLNSRHPPLSSSRVKLAATMQKLKPTNDSMARVRELVRRLEASSRSSQDGSVVILTSATFSYREVAINWIKHMEALGVRNYGVLCFDEHVWRLVGAAHGVLMSNSASNYSDSDGSVSAANRAKKQRADAERAKLARNMTELVARARQRREAQAGRAVEDAKGAGTGVAKGKAKGKPKAKSGKGTVKLKRAARRSSSSDPYEATAGSGGRRLDQSGDGKLRARPLLVARQQQQQQQKKKEVEGEKEEGDKEGEEEREGEEGGSEPRRVRERDMERRRHHPAKHAVGSHASSGSGSGSAVGELLRRHKEAALLRRSMTSKVRATSTYYTSYQMAKFEAIRQVLALGKTVIWSDTDAVWLSRCAYDGLVGLPAQVDVAGQRALFPTTLSLLTGSCLCGGFFMLRPSAATLALVDAVRKMLLLNEDDQSALNKALLEAGALDFGSTQVWVPVETAAEAALVGGKLSGKMKKVWRRNRAPYNSTTVSYTLVRAPRARGSSGSALLAQPQARLLNTSAAAAVVVNPAANRTLLLALLPYPLFPRGTVTVPVTQTMTREERREHRSHTVGNATFRALWRNRTTYPIQHEQHEQAIEWRRHAGRACVWHIISNKESEVKLATMRRDGVSKLTPAQGWVFGTGPNATYSSADVHRFLYPGASVEEED